MFNPTPIYEHRQFRHYPNLSRPVHHKEVLSSFVKYLVKNYHFNADKLKEMDAYWTVKIFAKNECFNPEHPENKEMGFIIRGAVKVYREYRGKQQIVALLREGQLNTIKPHFSVFMKDSYTCACVENTIMVTIDEQKLTKLLIEKPFFSTFFKNLNEHLFVYLESRLSSFQLMSAQQRYDDLLNNQPDLLIRFSLNDIANYLGIERETLSRIRNMANHRDRLFRQVK